MKRTLLTALVALLFAIRADAAVILHTATLGPESLGATGSGTVEVSWDDVAHTLEIDATWSGLSGVTTVAHIHCCTGAPGAGTVGVAVTPGTLPAFPGVGSGTPGVSAGAYNVVLDLTQDATYTNGFRNNFGGGTAAGAEARLIQGFVFGDAYFNIHSSTFGGGEIRGFPRPAAVPEPATLALLGLGLAGALGLRRRFR